MLYFERYAPAVGRLLLIVLFFVSGVGKVAAPAATKAYIADQGLPFPDLAYWLAVIVELGVGALFLAWLSDAVGGRRTGPAFRSRRRSLPPQSRRSEPDAEFPQGSGDRGRFSAGRGVRRRRLQR